jgi:excisionase family DNA binding protein
MGAMTSMPRKLVPIYLTYDAEVDALALQLSNGKGHIRSREIAPGIYVDFDSEDHIVALEILDASQHVPRANLKRLRSPAEHLTLREAAKESGLSPTTLRVQIRNGRIRATKKGRDWLINDTDLENYLSEIEGPVWIADHPRRRNRQQRARLA